MKSKKFVLAGLVLLAITMVLLPLSGCKNDSVPEPTRYAVSFDKGDNSEYTGDLPADITVESGTKLTAEQLKGLADTADYIFEGWYDGKTKAEGGTYTVTKDVTLEAKWRDRGTVASVAFTPAGGALDYGDTVTLSSQEGATIHYTVNDGEEKTGDSPVTVSVTGDTTITAKATKDGFKDSEKTKATYTLKRYTVTFNAKGGSEVAPQVVESGQTATRPEPDPTKDGWTFLGWYEDSGLTKEFDFSTPVTADITLYAKWRANPGTMVSDGLTIGEIKLEKTSEVQVLSEAVNLSSLYVVDSEGNSVSKIFVENRVVSIQPFVMGQYEVTQQLYFAVMGKNPSYYKTGTEDKEPKEGGLPVEQVSWYDAVVFCNRLSQLTGLDPVYSKGGTTDTSGWGEVPDSSNKDWDEITCNWNANGYRLPTEAEWELAARGGKPKADVWQYTYAGTNEEDELKANYAWYSSNSDSKTHQVGTMKANSLGLHDMSGNVWEWCWDWWPDSGIGVDTPSGGADSGSNRVLRGGSHGIGASRCTVSGRNSQSPDSLELDRGFRLVRSAN